MRRIPPVVVLIGALVFCLAAIPAAALPNIPSSAFEASSGCGCHAALMEQWRPSMHAQALSDPLYLSKLGEAIEATDGELAEFCTRCHGPIAIMSGELDGLDQSALSEVSAEGVTCDYCHQVVGTGDPIGNVSAIIEADGVKKAQYDDAVSPGHETAYSQFHETAEFCGACHNVDHPVNGMHLEATYTEWKNGPYAADGIVCQDCHMTPGPGVTKPNPGKAAGMGPERAHLYTMTFAGGNVALGDAALAEERLKAATSVRLEVAEVVSSGEDVLVKTTITNIGAGHYVPTGLTEVRQMWLEVTATDDSGAELLRERHTFGSVLRNEEGEYPVELWEAVDFESDDRIPPGESVSDEWHFDMGEGPVTVDAVLYYRSASEEMAKKAGVDVPTTTMASAQSVVFTSADAAAQGMSESGSPPDDEEQEESASPLAIVAVIALVVVAAIAMVLVARRRP